MKELVIINAYTPDYTRQKLLEDFIGDIDTNLYDIMVVSHSPLSERVCDRIDYFIYEKENLLLTTFDTKYNVFWENNQFRIDTTETKRFNQFIATYRLFYLGITNAKKLGYEKCHIIEYDTRMSSMENFIINSKLLDDHSIVYFKTDYSPNLISFPQSYNINKLEDWWFEYNQEEIDYFVKTHPHKTLEDYQWLLLKKQSLVYARDYKEIESKGISLNLFHSGDNIWICPVINDNNDLAVFINNKSNEDAYIRLITDTNKVIELNIKGQHWAIRNIEKYDVIQKLDIIDHNTNLITYDFNTIDKSSYKKKNTLHEKGV